MDSRRIVSSATTDRFLLLGSDHIFTYLKGRSFHDTVQTIMKQDFSHALKCMSPLAGVNILKHDFIKKNKNPPPKKPWMRDEAKCAVLLLSTFWSFPYSPLLSAVWLKIKNNKCTIFPKKSNCTNHTCYMCILGKRGVLWQHYTFNNTLVELLYYRSIRKWFNMNMG